MLILGLFLSAVAFVCADRANSGSAYEAGLMFWVFGMWVGFAMGAIWNW